MSNVLCHHDADVLPAVTEEPKELQAMVMVAAVGVVGLPPKCFFQK